MEIKLKTVPEALFCFGCKRSINPKNLYIFMKKCECNKCEDQGIFFCSSECLLITQLVDITHFKQLRDALGIDENWSKVISQLVTQIVNKIAPPTEKS